MKQPYRGLLLAGLHLALVLSLGAKLLIDRATLPRAWVRTAPVDPNLPIRGRYVSLYLVVEARRPSASPGGGDLWVENGQLVAGPKARLTWARGASVAVLAQPIAFFIPERVPDPSRRSSGEELWAEVTVPKKGPPRPIRLGVKKGGVLTPLDLR